MSAVAPPARTIPDMRDIRHDEWMAMSEEYEALVSAIEACGAVPFTSRTEYLAAHHLPNWYPNSYVTRNWSRNR